MFTAATIDRLESFARPAFETGWIPRPEWRAIKRTLRAKLKATPDAETPQAPRQQLLSAAAVAERWDVCSETVLRLYRAGDLPGIHLNPGSPKTLRFRLADVEGHEQRREG